MTLTMVQLEPDGAVAITLMSVMVSGGMPRRAALWAACNGPGAASAPAMLETAAAGTAFRRSRRFIVIPPDIEFPYIRDSPGDGPRTRTQPRVYRKRSPVCARNEIQFLRFARL